MQCPPCRSGFDARLIKMGQQLISGAPEFGRDQKATQPFIRLPPRRFGHRLDSIQVEKCRSISGGDVSPLLDPEIQYLQLASCNAGEDITHCVIEADFRMLIADAWIARLSREETSSLNQVSFLGHQNSPAARGDDFVAVQGKYADLAETARRQAFVGCAERFCRVFQYRDAETPAGLEDRIHTRRLTEQVDHNYRLWQAAATGAFFQCFEQQHRIQIPRFGLAIDKNWPRA